MIRLCRNAATPDRTLAGLACGVLLAFAPLGAQEPASLSLEDALAIAERNNPEYRAELNDVDAARWNYRRSWGAMLPGAAVSAGFQYEAAGNVRLGSLSGNQLGVSETPATYLSDYSIGLSYTLDASRVAQIGLERARLNAASANSGAAAINLRTEIVHHYIAVLREQEAVELARAEIALAERNLDLARTRAEVGAATTLQVQQAEVELGRARVGLLTAENTYLREKLILLRFMGVELERDFVLTTQFPVFEPDFDQEELIDLAMRSHPQLRSLRAQRAAGESGVRAARFAYLPSLQLSAGWSGFTREVADEDAILSTLDAQSSAQISTCQELNLILTRLDPPLPAQDCTQYTVTEADRRLALSRNDVFPFDYADQPFSARAQISLPIFQGFSRQAQIEEAKVAADDARYALRGQELQLRAEVIAALHTLRTAYTAVQLQERNREVAARQLVLAQERYRLGGISFLELSEATTLKARADQAYVASIYDFHQSMAALEAAVGQELTTGEPPRTDS